VNTIKLAIALTLVFAVNAYAGPKEEYILDKINPAWQRLDTLSQSYLTDEQKKTIQELAFATATGDICAGFKVDKNKFVGAFKIFDDKKLEAMSPEDQRLHEQKLLVLFGIATGLFSAEGLLAKEDFCAAAEALRQKPQENYWKPKE
jgi:hypothetical protein